jgi:cytochrome c
MAKFIWTLLPVTMWIAGSMHAAGSVAAQTATRSVWDGVYTEVQAKRGRESYEYSCATCHQPGLEGDEARDIPALYGDDFVNEWGGKSVKDLYELIRKMMPKDAPGSLKNETYADIVAYLLQSNEFPAGTGEMAADAAALGRIKIDKVPPVK